MNIVPCNTYKYYLSKIPFHLSTDNPCFAPTSGYGEHGCAHRRVTLEVDEKGLWVREPSLGEEP